MDVQLTQQTLQNVDLRDTLNQEKQNNLRLLQQLRALRIEARKRDKTVTKKNFLIGALTEKIELLQRSNASLFKELDQSIIMQARNGDTS
jgi:hypothetical protein